MPKLRVKSSQKHFLKYMPELPEVETTVRGLRTLVGLVITDIWTDYFSSHYHNREEIKNTRYFPSFKKKVDGARIFSANRRGKNILIGLSNGYTIVIHMKMTGHLMHGEYRKLSEEERKFSKESWVPVKAGGPLSDPKNKFIHLVFSLSDKKQLVLSDVRRFARVCLFKTENIMQEEGLKNLGPEPLSPTFTYKVFKKCLEGKNGPIKKVLMDQKVLAGIGNIYSDEILWRSAIHPLQRVEKMPEVCFKAIFVSLKSMLKKGINFGGDSTSDYRDIRGLRGRFQKEHRAYRRKGLPCERAGCKGVIKRIVVAGRSAHFCPIHQKIIE